jgi:heterodisulfide reductase subunit C
MTTKSLIFLLVLLITLGLFAWTMRRIFGYLRLTRPAFKIDRIPERLMLTLKVAIGQSKILRMPVSGILHALVFWGFMVITVGSIEMVIDGLANTHRALGFLGPVYDLITGSGDVMAWVVLFSILIFLIRRLFLKVKRFKGVEMKPVSKYDANMALSIIGLLMVSLIGLNLGYLGLDGKEGAYPFSRFLLPLLDDWNAHQVLSLHENSWWTHILLIFAFANILPYSKHFHVFMSLPNVFLSRLEPLGYLPNMESVMNEVKLMMDPSAAPPPAGAEVGRFGVKDVEDTNWKNYLDALTCTECGRCTSVCPANITGKLLSPRKIFIDLRARMKEKGPGLLREGRAYNDQRALLRDHISAEELWACTTCNACAQECPLNINHPTLIVDMRRYLVMEEAAAPSGLNAMFTNIENNGAPWQYSLEDRLKWTEGLSIKVKAS